MCGSDRVKAVDISEWRIVLGLLPFENQFLLDASTPPPFGKNPYPPGLNGCFAKFIPLSTYKQMEHKSKLQPQHYCRRKR